MYHYLEGLHTGNLYDTWHILILHFGIYCFLSHKVRMSLNSAPRLTGSVMSSVMQLATS